MSADDFQTKYASFMESIVKSTIAETTKLFETMVDELKSELSKVKKENEALRTRSREKETTKTRSWHGPDMRDSAVQCDLLSGNPLLTGQSQPVRQSAEDPNYQCDQEELVYSLLKDHDYDAAQGHFQLTKPQIYEATAGCKEICAVTDSAPRSPGGTDAEGPQTDQHFLFGELRKHDKGLVTTLQPSLEGNFILHESQNQPVNPISTMSYNTDVASSADQTLSEFGIKRCYKDPTTFKEPLVVPQLQIQQAKLQIQQVALGERAGKEQTYVTVLQYSGVPLAEQAESTLLKKEQEGVQMKCGATQDKPNIKIHMHVKKNKRERKQPSENVKRLKNTSSKSGAGHEAKSPSVCSTSSCGVPEVSTSQSEDVVNIVTTTTRNRSLDILEQVQNPNAVPRTVSVLSLSVAGVSSEYHQPCMELEKLSSGATSSDFALHSRTAASLPAPSCKLRERSTSVTLQDAMLLVEAMDQSTKNCASSQENICTLLVTLPSEIRSPLPTPALSSKSPPTSQAVEEIPTTEQSTNTCDSQSQTGVPQQDCVNPSNVITSVSSLTSTLAESSSSPVIWSAPLQTITRDSVLNKIIIIPKSSSSGHPPRTIAPLSPNQISAVVSTVAAAQNKYSLGLCQRENFTAAGAAETTSNSLEQKSHIHTQIKIIIPRSTSAVVAGQTQPSAAILITEENSVGPASDVTLSTSHSTHTCTSSQITSNGKGKSSLTVEIPLMLSPGLEGTHPEKAEASLNESVLIPVTPEMDRSLSTKLVVVPELQSRGMEWFDISQPDHTSKTINLIPEVSASSTSLSPNSKETSAVGALSESPVSKNKSSATSLEEEPATCVPPRLPSSVWTKSPSDSDEAELCTVPEQSSNVNKEIISNVKQKLPIQLTPIIATDLTDPRSQWTKTQFLAQLAVVPVNQNPQKVSTNESAVGQATEDGTSTDNGGKSQKKSIVARLRSHLKIHSLAKPIAGKQHNPVRAKKPSLENVSTTDQESTEFTSAGTKGSPELQKESRYSEATVKKQRNTDVSQPDWTTFQHLHVCPLNPVVSKDVPSLKNRTNSTLIISQLPETEVKSIQRTLNNDSVNKGAPTEAMPRNPEQQFIAQECASKKLECSISLSSILDQNGRIKTHLPSLSGCRSTPCTHNATSEISQNTNLGLKSSLTQDETCVVEPASQAMVSEMSSTSKDDLSSNKSKATSVCLRSSTTKDTTSLLMSGSHKRCISAQENASPKKMQSICSHQDRSAYKKTETLRPRSTRDYSSSNKSHVHSVTPKESNFMKNGCRCKKSQFNPYLAKEENSSKQLKRESSSMSGNTGPTSPQGAKLPTNGTSPGKTGEIIAKKSRLSQNCSISENVKLRNALKLATAAKEKTENVKLRNTQKLAKSAKATTIVKINKPKQSKLNITNQVANCGNEESGNGKKTVETTSLGGKGFCLSPIQKEARPPRSQNHTVVSTPSLSHQPIPVRAASVASPLQPLTLIGSRLLKNQCGECGRVLSSGAALESHISLHTGHRPFSCTLCGKSFPDAKGLRRHGRVHRNGRIHICQQCGKGFVYGFGLAKHVQMVHGKIKPFVCQICNKAFFTKRDVEDHIRIHTGEKPFHCHLCEKKFVRKVELKVHLRWHNGEKRHWCPYCGKGFLDYNNLKRHKLIHTGEKPHSCPHCPKHFTQSGHLKKHVRNVHKIQ